MTNDSNSCSNYIETNGEGHYTQTASRFITHLSLEVRPARKESATPELNVLSQRVLHTLIDSGIDEKEIVEGGSTTYKPWFARRKEKYTGIKYIMLKVEDYVQLIAALDALEPLQDHVRHDIRITMKQPEFDPCAESHAKALSKSFEDARQKAQSLANVMGVELGKPLRTVEVKAAVRQSGFIGDQDWRGDSDRYTLSDSLTCDLSIDREVDSAPIELQSPTRDLWVRCIVRFSIE